MDALTIYLLKPIAQAADALDPRKRLVRHEVRDRSRFIGALYVAQAAAEPPRWLRFFKDTVDPLPQLSNRSASAVLLVERNEQAFAITFGYGRYFLKPGSWVGSFGLKVALNSIDPASIRSLERKTFDALSRLTRTQAVGEGTALQFGVDVEQDLLRAITGRPTDASLGTRVTGADALTVAAPERVEQLPARLGAYYARYRETRYKDDFAWIDHIAEVRDPKRIAELDEAIAERLHDGTADDVSLAPPEMIDWSVVRGFRYRQVGERFPELRLSDCLAATRGRASGRASALRTTRVYAVDDAGTAVDAWTVDRCIACELVVDGETFVRTNGRWYRIARGLVDEVNAAVAALERPMPALPAYDDPDEGAYNARVVQENKRFVLVDKKLLSHGGGSSRIEFCDVFTHAKQMIHVKRYCGSQTLSHLFAQGAVGAHLLLGDRAFREKLDAMLPRSHRVGSGRPDAREYEVVYAIVEGSGRRLVEVLPFFSRLMLRTTARQLGALGLGVSSVVVSVRERELATAAAG